MTTGALRGLSSRKVFDNPTPLEAGVPEGLPLCAKPSNPLGKKGHGQEPAQRGQAAAFRAVAWAGDAERADVAGIMPL